MIAQVKESFLRNVFADHSAQSRAAFAAYLDETLKFRKVELRRRGLINRIMMAHHEWKKMVWQERGDPLKGASPEYILRKILYLVEREDIYPIFHIPVPCGHQSSPSRRALVWDHFMGIDRDKDEEGDQDGSNDDSEDGSEGSVEDVIGVSSFSSNYPSYGRGIIAHELGHALSYFFTQEGRDLENYEDFMELRACSSGIDRKSQGRQAPSSHRLIVHEGDHYRTEESMADLLSYLALPDQKILYQCALLDRNLDNTAFLNVNISNHNARDTHLAPLVRVLQEAIHKRVDLPTSCQEFIKEREERGEFHFGACF